MIRSIFFVFLSITFSSSVMAEKDIRSFLLSAKNDVSYLAPDASMPGSSGLSIWINEAELRLKADTDNQLAYALRVRPKFGGERLAEKALAGLNDRQMALAYESAFNDALKARYIRLIDILEQRVQTDYMVERLSLVNIRMSLLRSLVQTTDFSPNELQEVELEHDELEALADLNLVQYRTMINDLGLAGENDLKLSSSYQNWLLPIASIEKIIADDAAGYDYGRNYTVRNNQLALFIVQEELRLMTKKNRSPINFFEVEYTNNDAIDVDVTLGIKLPLGGKPANISRRKIDIMVAKTELLTSEKRVGTSLARKRSSLQQLSWRFDTDNRILENIDTRLSRIPAMDITRISLELKQERLSRKKRLQEVHIQAVRNFIEYLHIVSKLSAQPLRNWMRAGTPQLAGA